MSGRGRGDRLAVQLVGAALLLYPARFRRRFGAEMLADFRDRLEERRAQSRTAALALVARTLVDVVLGGVREWLRPSLAGAAAGAGVRNGTRGTRGAVMDHLRLDFRFALRSLGRRPGFAAVAMITLALGMGANTAIFSVVNGVLLRPLPYPHPDELVMVWAHDLEEPGERGNMSQPDIESVRELGVLAAVEGYNGGALTLTGGGDPEQVSAWRATGGLLAVFGLTPLLGRDLTHADNTAGAARVVVLSHGFWQQRFGGSSAVIGSTIELSEQSYEIVGVAPPGFEFPGGVQLWTSYRLEMEDCARGCHVFRAIARLAPGVSRERASAEVARLAASLSEEYPESNFEKGLRLERLDEFTVGDVRDGLRILLGAVGVVLLIACANVANLLLVRASARRAEVSVRAALGASRGRLIAQVLAESLVLSAGGAVLGLMLAAGGVELLRRMTPGTIPRLDEVSLDGTVLLFSLVVTVLVALLFGASPASKLAGTPLVEAMRSEARGGQSPREGWSRAVLLSVEVGLSLVLLVGAGLLLRSLVRLYEVELGFDGRQVVRFSLNLPTARYDSLSKIVPFYERLEERLAALPGVESVGSAWGTPLTRGDLTGEVQFASAPKPQPGEETYASMRPSTPGYLRTMGIAVLRGRGIEPTDRAGTVPVAVVNETFVRQNLANEDPLGKRFLVTASLGYGSPTWTIVGVVRDVRRGLTAEPVPEVYVPQAQFGPHFMSVHVRARPGTNDLVAAIRREVRALDPNLPVSSVGTLRDAIRNDAAPTRFYLLLVSLFGGLAVLLAAVGLYGVVAYLVQRRTREIGIRIALGATRLGITRLVLRQAMWPAVFGVIAGLLASVATTRVMESILFEVDPLDPAVLVVVTALVLGVAVAATLLPARRATRVDPIVVLRAD